MFSFSATQVFTAIAEFDFTGLHVDLLVNDPSSKIVMLGTRATLNYLANSEHVLGDGTFKYCTKHFHQLYTFHAYGDNQVSVPCCSFLLPDKKETKYLRMLELLEERTSDLGASFLLLYSTWIWKWQC